VLALHRQLATLVGPHGDCAEAWYQSCCAVRFGDSGRSQQQAVMLRLTLQVLLGVLPSPRPGRAPDTVGHQDHGSFACWTYSPPWRCGPGDPAVPAPTSPIPSYADLPWFSAQYHGPFAPPLGVDRPGSPLQPGAPARLDWKSAKPRLIPPCCCTTSAAWPSRRLAIYPPQPWRTLGVAPGRLPLPAFSNCSAEEESAMPDGAHPCAVPCALRSAFLATTAFLGGGRPHPLASSRC